jgi:hypothetical protein
MKVKYDKDGLYIVLLVLMICIGINVTIKDQSILEGIGYTIGVIIPYVVFSIFYLIYALIKHKEVRFFTSWKVSIYIAIFQFLSMYSYLKNEFFSSEDQPQVEEVEQPRSQPEETTKVPFKKFLKSKGISMDIKIQNQYETFQPGNKYSNHYFNVVTDFPDNWEVDRGMSEYSLFRAYQADSALSLAISTVPIESENEGSNIFHNPLDRMNSMANGDYRSFLMNQLKKNTSSDIYDFQLSEEKIRSDNFLVHSYKYDETVDNMVIPFYSISYQTILWNVVYTIGYSGPLAFYDQRLMDEVLDRTNFIKY